MSVQAAVRMSGFGYGPVPAIPGDPGFIPGIDDLPLEPLVPASPASPWIKIGAALAAVALIGFVVTR